MADIGSRIKELRRANNMTQDELAQKLDVTRSAVGMYEQGVRKPDFMHMDALADLFDVSFDYLLGHVNTNSGYPRHSGDYNHHEGPLVMATTEMWDQGEMEKSDNSAFYKRIAAYYDGFNGKLLQAYKEASPDTQAAVRAILHVEEDPDGDR